MVGHDRGAYVASRLALDHPARVTRLVILDAVPIGDAAAAAVANGGVVVTTRPTPAIDPARGVRQDLQLIRLDRKLLADLVEQVAAGRLLTRVAATLPLTEAAEAHRRVLAGGVHGKLVLTID